MAEIFRKIALIYYISLFVVCNTRSIPHIEDTKDNIVYVRTVIKGEQSIKELWLYNLSKSSRKKLVFSKYCSYLSPKWITESIFMFITFPHSSSKKIKLGIVDFQKQHIKFLNLWSKNQENEPFPFAGIDYNNGNIIYYSGFMLLKIEIKAKKIKRVIPYRYISRFNIKTIDNFDICNGRKIILSAQTKKQVELARNTRFKRYCCDLYLYEICQDTLIKITCGDSLFSNEYPEWFSPDTIAFSSNRNGNYDLYIMSLKSKQIKQLTFTPDVEERVVTVSPDHKSIAYVRYYPDREDPEKMTEIWLMDLETKETKFLDYGDQPCWSPAK